jgi:hypothetical protein
LDDNAADDERGEKDGVGVRDAWFAGEKFFDAEREALARHDRERAEYGADEDVDEHVGVAEARRQHENESNQGDNGENCENNELFFVKRKN